MLGSIERPDRWPTPPPGILYNSPGAEWNVQYKFPRVDSAAHHAVEFGAVGIYIQESRVNDRIMAPIAPVRDHEVETPVKTVFHRVIIAIQWVYRINLQNRWVTIGDDAPTRQGIKSCHCELSHLLSEELSRKPVKYYEQSICGSSALSASNTNSCGLSGSV